MKRHVDPVIIGLVKHKGKYLLTKRDEPKNTYHNMWQIPGGGLEYGEEVIHCLKREMREETGLRISSCVLLPVIKDEIRNHWHGILIAYLCEVENPTQVKLNHEASEYGWFSVEEIEKLTKSNQAFDDVLVFLHEAEKTV